MKTLIIFSLLIVAAFSKSHGAFSSFTYNGGFANAGAVPDGNLSGWSDTRTVGGLGDVWISDLSVTLNISGGYNGDLYVYLSYNGALLPLMNRLGVGASDFFGYGDAGLNVTFSDMGANNIHFYGGGSVPTGTWQPDGRAIDPLSAASAFDLAGTATFANRFSGMNPNGEWTLFIADVSGGGGSPTVTSWGLGMTVAPEPMNMAAGLFGLLFGGTHLWRWCRKGALRSKGSRLGP